MWHAQMKLLPGAHAPDLYPLGDGVQAWAARLLQTIRGDRLIVVGCSVGGSCALEIAALAPERVAGLVLIGTKAAHRPDPALEASVLKSIRDDGLGKTWDVFWAGLFASDTAAEAARRIALRQAPAMLSRGVAAFHARPGRERLLAALQCPVAVVSGSEDKAPGVAVSTVQAAMAPRGRLHIIPACGHYVPMEQPEHLNAILTEMIAALH